MSSKHAVEFDRRSASRKLRPKVRRFWRDPARIPLTIAACALTSFAQSIQAPPRLEPTANALTVLQKCGQSVSRSAPQASKDLLQAQTLLTRGLLIGWNNRSGEFAAVPPPTEYVEALQQEAKWCQETAEILNTDPARKQAAERALEGIANDLRIKVEDCRAWGMGRLITIVASTLKNGQPDPGWTVMYKWVSVSGLNTAELSFPKESSPTSKAVPPGIYSVYAIKQVGDTTKKTEAKTISAFQKDKVQCEIPVP
jgi:hypothetical protein